MASCAASHDQPLGTAAAAGYFVLKVLASCSPAEKAKKLAAELANGRLTMMAIMDTFFLGGFVYSAWGGCALYTAFPLRAI